MELYIGRILGGGRTKDNSEALVYGVSARSEENKIRIGELYPSRVFINSPLFRKKELTQGEREILERQQTQANFIFYNAILISQGDFLPFAVVSNGRHTNKIVNRYKRSAAKTSEIVKSILNQEGPELDGSNNTPQTPRIAGLLEVSSTHYTLGIVSKPGEAKVFVEQLSQGIRGLSTYAGNPDNPRDMVINHNPRLIDMPAEGRTAQQLADDLFDWMPRNFIVCTAAAVWNSRSMRWKLAVRNLYS